MESTLDVSKLNLRKGLVLNLKKSLGLGGLKAQVKLCVDRSGSMEHLYNNGTVQRAVERLMGLGLAFDDNGEVDSYFFHTDVIPADAITVNNLSGYVDYVTRRMDYGGTNYAPFINQICADCGVEIQGVTRKTPISFCL